MYSTTGRDVVQDSVARNSPLAYSQENEEDAQDITEADPIDDFGKPEDDNEVIGTKLSDTKKNHEFIVYNQDKEWYELVQKYERWPMDRARI
jgi:hypothetical protein